MLVFCGMGTAVLTAGVQDVGVGILGVALAVGLSVMTMAYAVGHVSGGHFNPAVTVGLAVGRRFSWPDVVPYIVAQLVAVTLGALFLLIVASGQDGFTAKDSGFASNGYGDHSPGGYGLLAVLVVEVVITALFLYVILGAASRPYPGETANGDGWALVELVL